MNPDDARAALHDADAASARMARRLRLPSYFHVSIGAAIAVQVATTAAWAPTGNQAGSAALLAGGVVVFVVVAAVQLARFRRLNGAWVDGLASRAVLGTSALSSVVYAVGLALAIWAGYAAQAWLVALVSVASGAGYAAAGRRWWQRYQGDPGGMARGQSAVELAALVALAVAGLVLLVSQR